MAFPHCDVHDIEGLLWAHVALVSLCVILIVASFNSQFKDAAPYGRHAAEEKAKAWGFPVKQRVAHIISDGLPGIPFLIAVYLLYAGLIPSNGDNFSQIRPINVILLAGWLLHYLYRGVVHPLITPYSSKTVAIGITAAGIFPNLLFSYLIAAQLACTVYPDNWASQPRFIIGVVLYCVGTAINRWADLKLRAGRLEIQKSRRRPRNSGASPTAAASVDVGGSAGVENAFKPASNVQESLLGVSQVDTGEGVESGQGDGEMGHGHVRVDGGKSQPPPSQAVREHYFIPRGGLHELVSCPNYLGELVEWIGYALALWSWPALSWVLFGASTFIPRSLAHHRWYKEHFGSEYPASRKALIPFIL